MKSLLFILAMVICGSSTQSFAQETELPTALESPTVKQPYQLNTATGELVLDSGPALAFPRVLGDLATWASLKEFLGRKDRYTTSTEGIVCIGDTNFAAIAACENGQTEIPSSRNDIKDSTNVDKQASSLIFAEKLIHILSLIPIEGGSGTLKDLLVQNTPAGSAFIVKSIHCRMNALSKVFSCVIQADAFKKN